MKTLLTPEDECHRIHTYFTGSPVHPDGQRLLYTRLRNLSDPADICIWDRRDGSETVIGQATNVWFHSSARAWFVSQGSKVMYHSNQDWLAQEAESPATESNHLYLLDIRDVPPTIGLPDYAAEAGSPYPV